MPVMRAPTSALTGEAIPPEDLRDAATNLMGPGFAGTALGTVVGATPAAEGLMNFVRGVWPSLGRAVDKLPDIRLHYAEEFDPSKGAYYQMPNRTTLPGGKIGLTQQPRQLNPEQLSALKEVGVLPPEISANQSYNARTSVQSLLHELLHAIYYHKGYDITATPPTGRRASVQIMEKSGMSPWRRGYFTSSAPQHGALDAMSMNIANRRLGPPIDVHPDFR